MTFKEAEAKLLSVRWKTKTCGQGAACWCRMIAPTPPIIYGATKEELLVVHAAVLTKKLAKHIVDLHNANLK